MRLLWEEQAWEAYCTWQSLDKKTLKRINLLIKDIQRENYDGKTRTPEGKPERMVEPAHRRQQPHRVPDPGRCRHHRILQGALR